MKYADRIEMGDNVKIICIYESIMGSYILLKRLDVAIKRVFVIEDSTYYR